MPEWTPYGGSKLPEVLRQYLTGVTFTECPERFHNFGSCTSPVWYNLDRFTAASRKEAEAELTLFESIVESLNLPEPLADRWPFDFHLDRNRHGAGACDGHYPDAMGQRLKEVAQSFGPTYCQAHKGRLYIYLER